MTRANTPTIYDLVRLDRAVRAEWEPCAAPGHEGAGCQTGWIETRCGCLYTFHTINQIRLDNPCDECRGVDAPAVSDGCQCGHADHDVPAAEGFSRAPGHCPAQLGEADLAHGGGAACRSHDWAADAPEGDDA